MNTRNKGNRIRLLGIKQLEKEHYWVDVVEKTSKWARIKDLFGLFDAIAIKRHQNIISLKFIQFKSNQKPPLTEYKKFSDRYCGKFFSNNLKFKFSTEIWIKKDYVKDWEIIIL